MGTEWRASFKSIDAMKQSFSTSIMIVLRVSILKWSLLAYWLRESDPEFHEFVVKTEISDFFISHP